MKKRISSVILLVTGLVFCSPPTTAKHLPLNTFTAIQSSIPDAQVQTILKRVAPQFDVSFLHLLAKYHDSECTIIQITPKTFKVSYGGQTVLDLEDTL